MVQGGACSRRRTAIAGALVVLALGLLAPIAAAQERGLTVQLAGMTADQWPEAQAVLTAVDADGRPVLGLDESSFTALLNDSPVPVDGVARGVDNTVPIDVVLALDTSGSMEGAALDQAKAAALSFLDQLSSQDRVAVLTLHSQVDVVLPFTADREAARLAIDGLVAGGSTALYQATAESIRLAAGDSAGRRAVVLLSDGTDNGSPVSREEALAAAETGGVPVFIIGLGQEIDRDYLQTLASETGGRFAETPTPEGLAELYDDVGELLRGQYILTLDASELDLVRSAPATLRVEVTAAGLSAGDERTVCPQQVCVSLNLVAEGELLEGMKTLEAQVIAQEPVVSVSLFLDGVVVERAEATPYVFTVDASRLAEGEHTLAVEAETPGASARTAEVAVRVGSAAGGGSGNSLLMIAGAATVGVLAVLMVALIVRRRRRGRGPDPDTPSPKPTPPDVTDLRPSGPLARTGRLWTGETRPATAAQPQKVLGGLRVIAGALRGERYAVGTSPFSIGTGHRCFIELPDEDADEVGSEHMRVWVRDDHLVVHELKRLTAFGAEGGRWAFLSSGDSFTIGSHTFQFELGEVATKPSGGASNEPVPNVLRDRPASEVPAAEGVEAGPGLAQGGTTNPEGAQPVPQADVEATSGVPQILGDVPPTSDVERSEKPSDEDAA